MNLLDLYTTGYNSSQIIIWHTVIFFRLDTPLQLFWHPIELSIQVKFKVTLRLTVSHSVSLGVEPHLGLMTRYLLLFDSYGLVFVGHPLWRKDGSVFCICCWPLPAQSFSGPSPLGPATVFYCLRYETSVFVVSYDSQGHGGGIRPSLHTVVNCQLLVAYCYIASGRTTAQQTHPLPNNGFLILLRIRWNMLIESLVSNEYMRTHNRKHLLQHLFYCWVRVLRALLSIRLRFFCDLVYHAVA
jgi:hypothetical protein